MPYEPEIVQVIPFDDYKVAVYFSDGKIVEYDVKPKLDKGVFKALRDMDIFLSRCGIINDTLGWDINGDGDPSSCIDIDPYTLYALPDADERIA